MFVLFVPAWMIYFLSIVLTLWCLVSLLLFWSFIRYAKAEYNKLVQIILFEEDDKPSNLIVLHSDETGY